MSKKGLILHHWDTDGIASCAILQEELAKGGESIEWTTFTPKIGNYFLNQADLDMIESGGFDELLIADMAIPTDNIRTVSKWVPSIRHFDHHYQEPHDIEKVEHINPVGMGKTQAEYPACTVVLMEHFKRSMDLPTVLGMVGDREQKILKNKVFSEEVRGYLKKRRFSIHDVMRLCELIDANYKINDIDGVGEAVKVLRMAGEDPGPIFHNKAWMGKAATISKEINRWVRQRTEEVQGKKVLWVDTPNHIISTIGRRLHKIMKEPVIIVNTGIMDFDQIYARGAGMKKAIEYVRSRGLRGGGKEDVMGVLVEKGDLEAFLPEYLATIPDK